jgi:hypothetical protein
MRRASQPEAQERRSIGGGSRAEKPRESVCDLRIERNDGVMDLVKANMKRLGDRCQQLPRNLMVTVCLKHVPVTVNLMCLIWWSEVGAVSFSCHMEIGD